ncbi:MAG: hypothetical protein ACREQ2_25150 [Candidatus Binatia bacterium]
MEIVREIRRSHDAVLAPRAVHPFSQPGNAFKGFLAMTFDVGFDGGKLFDSPAN